MKRHFLSKMKTSSKRTPDYVDDLSKADLANAIEGDRELIDHQSVFSVYSSWEH